MNNREFDKNHIWHPYSSLPASYPVYEIAATEGVYITLADGRKLIDGMSSWWSAIHGYNHPVLQDSLIQQTHRFPHVMFGGLTHEPAISLARRLTELTALPKVFFADSGSVAVEVGLKMSIQYQTARGKAQKSRIISFAGAYHGDTLGAMAVCDPVNSMHSHFTKVLPKHLFAPKPPKKLNENYIAVIKQFIKNHHRQTAAVIIEPVVQGAGGMYFYTPEFLKVLRKLCDEFDILLIADEIAAGFGRTGKMFGCEHGPMRPDIMCIGKALTGGVMTLAAVLTTEKISRTISSAPPYVLMHGPTFMANPLACAAASASIKLLLATDWQAKVNNIANLLKRHLAACEKLAQVKEVRVLGAIGVVELKAKVDMRLIQPELVNSGVWVRPFNNLVYVMPAYIISDDEIALLCRGIFTALKRYFTSA